MSVLIPLLLSGAAPGKSVDDARAALLRTGQYAEVVKRTPRGRPRTTRGAILTARAEVNLGRVREARQRLEAASVGAPDDLPLRAELIRLAHIAGDRAAVRDLVDRAQTIWSETPKTQNTAANLLAHAVTLRYANNWEAANRYLREAVRADRTAVEANLEWGQVFLEKHAADNAATSFRDVLKVDPTNPDGQAGLGRALLEHGYDTAGAESALASALHINPHHAGALALQGEIALDAEDLPRVAAAVTALRRTNPQDPDAAWLAAARALLVDDKAGYDRERQARETVRPGDGDFYLRVAEALVRHRRYNDARDVAAAGVARDETHARLLASLGNTLLRLGDEEQGLKVLRKAWQRDPYDVRIFNLLTLFEKVIPAGYVTFTTPHFRFRVETQTRASVEQVVAPFLEGVYRSYAARYGMEPPSPITVELYGQPSHFAIRTVGLPRLGVAAVCFGKVITSQSPSNGAFNWGQVLAHELAHVFALTISRNRVPRWLTEGLAEHETARLRPEWRRHDDLLLRGALDAGTVPSLSALSQAFVRARDPEAAQLAYLVSARAVEYLETRFGFAKIKSALVAYGQGGGDHVIATAMGTTAQDIDTGFRLTLQNEVKGLSGQFLPTVRARAQSEGTDGDRGAGLRAFAAGKIEEAGQHAARAKAKAPHDPGTRFLAAEVALGTGRPDDAWTDLESLLADGHDGYDLRLSRALVALKRGDTKRVTAELQAAITLVPNSVEAHALLAEHLLQTDQKTKALPVQMAALKLDPQGAALAKTVVLELARQGRAGDVLEFAPRSLFINPGDGDVHAALGRALVQTGASAEGLASLERALLFSPTDPDGIRARINEAKKRKGGKR